MTVPNLEYTEIPKAKILDYLLNLEHPDGGPKARFFIKHGFSAEGWEALKEVLTQHIRENEVSETVEGRFGTKYIVEGPVTLADNSESLLRSVWIISHGAENPRLVTAFPIS